MNKERLQDANGIAFDIDVNVWTIIERSLQELMEDAYAFTSSFVAQPFKKEEIAETSAFAEPDLMLL